MRKATIKNGTCYGHLFENPKVKVERWIYWAFSFEVQAGDIEASVTLEWLRFDPALLPLSGAARATSGTHPDAECSVYIWSHEWVDSWSILAERQDNDLEVALEMTAPALTKDDEIEVLRIDQTLRVPFDGIILSKGSLPENPKTDVEVLAVLEPFAGDQTFSVRDEGWRFVASLAGA